jgi:peptidoglycan/xylan/chitin deacetylase (PgdA/CDA1 family)
MFCVSVYGDGSALVLCYHTFLGRPAVYTDFSIDEFRHHIDVIQSRGYRFISMKEALSNSITGDKNVVLVLDDGNASAYRAYQAVLKPRKIKAVFAIYPGIINRASYAMTWDDVSSLHKDGNDIVSHGYFHEYLNQKLKDSRPKDFDKETQLSKKIIEGKLGGTLVTYVYPFGLVTDVGRASLKRDGYLYGFSLIQSPMLLPIKRNGDLLSLPRYMMTRSNAASILKKF